jgi:hypothetical protein
MRALSRLNEHKQTRNVRNRWVVLGAAFLLALVAGCAHNSAKDRDLNAEAMQQMGFGDGEPGI